MSLLALGIGSLLLGGVAGGISAYQRGERERKALERQRDNAWDQYLLGKTLSDKQFAIQKGESLYQLGEQERSLGEGMNQFMNEHNTAALARAFGEQDARIQTASGIGASLAAEGASGTRGGSSGALMRDYAAQSLERQIGTQRQQDANALAGTLQGANRARAAIYGERESWGAGGWRAEQKAAQDAHNLSLAKLGKDNFDWATGQSEPGWMDYAAGIFGGMSSGMGLASSLYSFDQSYDIFGKLFKKGG